MTKKNCVTLQTFFTLLKRLCESSLQKTHKSFFTLIDFINTYSQFVYFGPKIKFCGWAYKMIFCIWNFMPISKIAKKKFYNRSSNHKIKIRSFWVRSLDLFSDLNFYERPSFFTIFWNWHKIPNTIIHLICPTTKFNLRTIIYEFSI